MELAGPLVDGPTTNRIAYLPGRYIPGRLIRYSGLVDTWASCRLKYLGYLGST